MWASGILAAPIPEEYGGWGQSLVDVAAALRLVARRAPVPAFALVMPLGNAAAAFFADRQLYLLRNVSKRGIGFFEAGNFYPDFIVWLLVGKKQYVTFVDPKGLRQFADGSSNPKVQFYRTIQEIEASLPDRSVILNSFIISSTRTRTSRCGARA